jgi:hypothetical protein
MGLYSANGKSEFFGNLPVGSAFTPAHEIDLPALFGQAGYNTKYFVLQFNLIDTILDGQIVLDLCLQHALVMPGPYLEVLDGVQAAVFDRGVQIGFQGGVNIDRTGRFIEVYEKFLNQVFGGFKVIKILIRIYNQ